MARGNFGPRGSNGNVPGEREISPTAQTVGRKLFDASGPQQHLVLLASGSARKRVFVEATTGDEAANLALDNPDNQGWRVAYVGPAGDQAPTVDKTEDEMAS